MCHTLCRGREGAGLACNSMEFLYCGCRTQTDPALALRLCWLMSPCKAALIPGMNFAAMEGDADYPEFLLSRSQEMLSPLFAATLNGRPMFAKGQTTPDHPLRAQAKSRVGYFNVHHAKDLWKIPEDEYRRKTFVEESTKRANPKAWPNQNRRLCHNISG